MPHQVDGAFLRAPCPVPSCPACEPNSGSVFPRLSTRAHSSRGGRHCYAIMWVNSEYSINSQGIGNGHIADFAVISTLSNKMR
jgi:hypothetical protein